MMDTDFEETSALSLSDKEAFAAFLKDSEEEEEVTVGLFLSDEEFLKPQPIQA